MYLYQLYVIDALIRVISSEVKRSRDTELSVEPRSEIWILTKLAHRSQPDLSTSCRSAALRSR